MKEEGRTREREREREVLKGLIRSRCTCIVGVNLPETSNCEALKVCVTSQIGGLVLWLKDFNCRPSFCDSELHQDWQVACILQCHVIQQSLGIVSPHIVPHA